ncbi:DUF4554 domain-containing protein isoform X2 [Anabas testudineus]|uniref:DUF4554 domain-containing protein isoform X2 n=1 Tax=Anabas testudineus TaxID=64144 RepID=UPI000E4635D1|nr:DUF4554 domain-containing protein isoform X2 [Anabas testudineus]
MLRQIQQVLRLLMIFGKQRKHRGGKTAGGFLVLLWTETGVCFQNLNCVVAAAGPWCTGIKKKELTPLLADLKRSLFLPDGPCPEPDPEELCAFTELHGPLKLLLSFQIKINLKFKFNEQILQRVFSVNIKSKVKQAEQPSLTLDVTCNTQPPGCAKKGCWCQGGHPVLGSRLPLSIPPHVMDQGLYGELSVQIVALLSPCMLQYPNLATQLTHIQVLVYSPSNVPVTEPSTFFQTLPAHLDSHDLGLHGLNCSSSKDFVYSCGTVYNVEQENWEDAEHESSLSSMHQSLLLFLFLQYSDPFISQIPDLMATEMLIEHHLEDILSNNRQTITAAVQTDLKNTLRVQNRRRKDQEKLHSAINVILSSSISIVSSSSNMDFRNACLNSMKVCDTYELSASLCESLRRVTSWKFKPNGRCYSAKTEEHPESDEHTRTEI